MRAIYTLLRFRRLSLVTVSMLVLVAGAASAQQVTFNYNTQPRTIRACRLLIPYPKGDGTWLNQGSDDHSLIFEGMRRFPDRPAGWDIENPLAPPAVVQNRPDHILKSTAAYWEVTLEGTQLTNMDLIYIYAGGQDAGGVDVQLLLDRPRWRDVLLKAAYEGATLWIDQNRNNAGLNVQSFPFTGMPIDAFVVPFSFTPAGQVTGSYRWSFVANGVSPDPAINARNWLLQYPFSLNNVRDVQYLGYFPRELNTSGMPPTVATQSASPDTVVLGDTSQQTVVGVYDGGTWQPNITISRYGAGAIVCTAGDVGFDVMNWWYGAHRNRPLQWEAADCKFAWNTAALASVFAQQRGNASQRASSVVKSPPPLSVRWQYPDRFDNIAQGEPPIVASPVLGNGMVYAVSLGGPTKPGALMCFDNDPAQDLDGDGRADDGIIDYSLGHSYDMVWKQTLPMGATTRWSSPTLATMTDANGAHIDVVLITLTSVQAGAGGSASGQICCYNAHSGALMWTRMLRPYMSGTASVVDLSTPVVFHDYVCVLASECDSGLPAPGAEQKTYGRVHCFKLSYNWAANDNGPKWEYPSGSNNPNGDTDVTGGNPTDHATSENQRTLPPFQDPVWVGGPGGIGAARPLLPPFPTTTPTLTRANSAKPDVGIDLLLHASSPISLTWSGGMVINDPTRGGSDYIIVPTLETGGSDYFNFAPYRVLLPEARSVLNTTIANAGVVSRLDDAGITALITGIWRDPADGRVYAYLRSGEAREYLLPSLAGASAPQGITNPLQLSQGAMIQITYQTRPNDAAPWNPETTASGTLPGPVRKVTTYPVAQRRTAGITSLENKELLAVDSVETNAPVPGTLVGDANGGIELHAPNGDLLWKVRPNRTVVDGGNKVPVARGGLAVERNNDTAYAAVAAQDPTPDTNGQRTVLPQVLALNADPKLQVQLYGGGEDSVLPAMTALTIRTIGDDGVSAVEVPVSAYKVDANTKTINFLTDQAGWVDNIIGMLWGKPVWVSYTWVDPTNPGGAGTPVTNELHVLPDIVRGVYTPGLVRLNRPLVRFGSLQFALPNGVPLARVAAVLDEAPFSANLAGLQPAGAWANGFLPRGLVDVRGLMLPGGEPLRPGSEIIISYDCYNPLSTTPGNNIITMHERHQVPYNFGLPVSSPAISDGTVHVGTEGYLPSGIKDGASLLQTPDLNAPGAATGPLLSFNSARDSLLSLIMDPVTGELRGSMDAAAIPDTSYGIDGGTDLGTPATTASPAISDGGLVVGSRLMRRLQQSGTGLLDGYYGEGYGFVSGLKPQTTLITDNTRLIEVTGQKLTWTCVGSMVAQYHERLQPAIGPQDLKVTPFNRPAKAIYLANGNILVADSGNDRVIEIDRSGRQVWPLTGREPGVAPEVSVGYDYYTATFAQNPNLSLNRPADCFRYYVTQVGNNTYTSTHGDLLPSTEMHTVIADTGNRRLIDVITTVDEAGIQTHRVEVLTPSAVRLPNQRGLVRVAYSKVQPIFDPSTNACIGYLCAAANLHQLLVVERGTRRINPAANAQPFYGAAGSNWAWLAWLYNPSTTGPDYAPRNPLIFRNIRDVELVREGTQAFLTVTCGQYAGRLLALNGNTSNHFLAQEAAGVFEFAMDIGGAPGTWARIPATDAGGNSVTVTGDDPIWWFTQRDYLFSVPATGKRRQLANIRYKDADGTDHWLDMAWNPVSAIRLPVDRRPVSLLDGAGNFVRWQREAQHLITNSAEIIQNLSRDNIISQGAPASLYSSVFVVRTDDLNDASPDNDLHDIDRRQVIPDPHDTDWTDPFNQPTFADRR